jgi:hypothetical protein
MATTLDVIADRVRSILAAAPFEFQEAETPFSFDLQPDGGIDRCFRLVDAGANRIVGGFSYSETRVDRSQIWVARRYDGDAKAAKRLLTRDMHSITAAMVRDGHAISGEYAVTDDGRLHELRADPGAEYAVLQLTVPVDYESQL